MAMLDKSIKSDFPIFDNNPGLVYLDSAASAQKPHCVIDKLSSFYQNDYANVHRGVYQLSSRSTDQYEAAREVVREHLNAKLSKQVIFTRGATESINLVAQSYLRPRLQSGDEILITEMEHHANIVPWQMVCQQTGAVLKVLPITDEGELVLNKLSSLITSKTKLIAVTYISNVLGTINPVEEIIAQAREHNIPVLLDGAQSSAHMKIDVQVLDCDFYVFSSHKMYGPTGVGVLYGKESLLDSMEPYQGGGDMISRVSFESTEYNVLPYKFEAGTPNIAGAIGLAEAINYLNNIGFDNISAHENSLLEYAAERVAQIKGFKTIGVSKTKTAIISFVLDPVHAHDIATIIDTENVATRAGHHCCMPLMQRYQLAATVRASFGLYNTVEDVDAFVKAINKVKEVFKL